MNHEQFPGEIDPNLRPTGNPNIDIHPYPQQSPSDEVLGYLGGTAIRNS